MELLNNNPFSTNSLVSCMVEIASLRLLLRLFRVDNFSIISRFKLSGWHVEPSKLAFDESSFNESTSLAASLSRTRIRSADFFQNSKSSVASLKQKEKSIPRCGKVSTTTTYLSDLSSDAMSGRTDG